jgi:hypothetical protein
MHPDVIAALSAARRNDLHAAARRTPGRTAAVAAPNALRHRTGWWLVAVGLRLAAAPRAAGAELR